MTGIKFLLPSTNVAHEIVDTFGVASGRYQLACLVACRKELAVRALHRLRDAGPEVHDHVLNEFDVLSYLIHFPTSRRQVRGRDSVTLLDRTLLEAVSYTHLTLPTIYSV